MARSSYGDEEFKEAWLTSTSIAECARKLSLKPSGGNYITLKNRARSLGLSRDHMSGQGHSRGKKKSPRRPLEDILVYGRVENTMMIKRRLLEEVYLDRRCYNCNLETWLDEPIPLELEHINGDRYDNRRENLTLLCPNCHALTPTYRGRNIQGSNSPLSTVAEKVEVAPRRRKEQRCLDCGGFISARAVRCRRCAGKYSSARRGRVIDWPPLEDVLERLEATSYSALGRELGVSDNAIRKYIARGGE